MLFETLLQGKIFLCCLYFGILCGIVLGIKNLVDLTFKKNKFVLIITDIAFLSISAILFVICINVFNFGEFRLFELLAFALGIVIEQKTINNLVEKFLILIYNFFTKILCKLKQTKLFAKIFK